MEGLLVETTQNVRLEYQPASVGERILAYLIDALVIFAWMVVVSMGFGVFSGQNSRSADGLIVLFAVLVLPVVFYDLLFETLLNGQSIGKKALGLRVIQLDGRTPTLGAYLFRWLFRLVDITLFSGVVAIVTIAVSGKGQRLGDVVAKTTVVKLRPPVTLERVVAVPTADPDYRVTYPQAAQLTDGDATTLRRALNKALSAENDYLLTVAADKARQLTGISTSQDDVAFLQTLLRDHAHLSLLEK
jgi:uncharacterized RDD family membrane protein YckC